MYNSSGMFNTPRSRRHCWRETYEAFTMPAQLLSFTHHYQNHHTVASSPFKPPSLTSIQPTVMPHLESEEHQGAHESITDKVAKESSSSTASDHALHTGGDGAKATEADHKSNPGPQIVESSSSQILGDEH